MAKLEEYFDKRTKQRAKVVIGGVDTHKGIHVPAVVDERGKILDTKSFAATTIGYRELLTWMRLFGGLAEPLEYLQSH